MTRVLLGPGVGRSGLVARLRAEKSLAVVVAAPALPLDEQVEDAHPDVVLLDGADTRAVAWLRERDAGTAPAILVLTDRPRGGFWAEWLRTGSRAVLPAHASVAVIVAAIEAITAGLVVLHPDTMPGARPALAASRVAAALSPREIEVLGMMADGLGNKIIAARLGISLHTVKFHVASIFAKLGAESRTEAVTNGVRQGVLMI